MDSEARRREQYSTLVILQLPDFGPSAYSTLHQQFGCAAAMLQIPAEKLRPWLSSAASRQLRSYQENPQAHPFAQQALRELESLEAEQVQLLTLGDSLYPALLATIPAPPPALYLKGELNNLSLPQIAIVGSRHPSSGGRANAHDFAKHLAAMGFAITSGLALGIDAAAHTGALAADGRTIAVMGTGIDTVYPRRHCGLAQQILEQGGTLLTEFPFGAAPHASHFPKRNRIISGLSVATLVVEAALKSGSLITARYALQQGREVFAVPGSIHNPQSRGCHQLLREGALLVEQVTDMSEALQGMLAYKWEEANREDSGNPAPAQDPEPEQAMVLDALGYDLLSFDQLVERTGMEPGPLLSALIRLELEGRLQQSADGYERCAATKS